MSSLLQRQKEQGELLDRTLAQLDKVTSAHNKLKFAVIAVAHCDRTCWCEFGIGSIASDSHTGQCESLYVALYGKERAR